MKTLAHNQQIRVTGFRNWNAITIRTLTGYSIEHNEDPSTEIARQIEFGNSILPWSYQAPSIMTSSYPGKEAALNAEKYKRDNAIEIAKGEHVVIEGVKYEVRVAGENYSDPVHFRTV